ncbi:MAG TPA: YiiD C-terminal domain-containing protein [Rhizomicrobium sp.]|nr:YiiD C-terminal domain-containing protein [Rhizomicrobium sp.]
MTDFQFLRAQLAAAIPFARHAGVEIVAIADGSAVARLVQAEQLSNHIGSVHAGALFTLGETASGAAMVGAFAEVAAQMRPLATSARISYLKLARGTLTARARTDVAGAELRQQLSANGVATFEVTVDIQDDRDRVVAQLVVSWRVTLPRSDGEP